MENKQNLLVEIGTEELPYKKLNNLSILLEKNITKILIEQEIKFENIKNFITPRRFSIIINGLPFKQKDKIEIKKGPNIKIAFDKNDTPKKPTIEFLKLYNINIKDVIKITNKKGTWLFFKKIIPGKLISNIIADIIEKSLKNLNFQKPMRWGLNNISFIRPIHWYIIMLNNKLINHIFLNIKSNIFTYGHRFLNNNKIKVTSENYEYILEKKGYVIPNFEKRKNIIKNEIKNISIIEKLNTIINDEILTDITGLVEYPFITIGKFDKFFLSVPKEILIAIILKYNKCIPLIYKNKLSNKFIIISNTKTENNINLIKWYNFSINSRLYDLTYIYNYEKKIFNKKNTEQLKNIIFQKELGSIYDKVIRVKTLLIKNKIKKFNNNEFKNTISLYKVDLLTRIVKEIPELEGIIAYKYNENNNNMKGLYEYNKPRNNSNNVPINNMGITLSILDKIDTIVGLFTINKEPTGNKDPFALRRIAINIIKIIVKNKLFININNIISSSLNTYNIINDKILNKIHIFIINRIDNIYKYKKYIDIIKNKNDIYDLILKSRTLKRISKYEYFKKIIILNKRVNKILDKIKTKKNKYITIKLLIEKEEKILFKKIKIHMLVIKKLYTKKLYFEAIKYILELEKYINIFFDKINIIKSEKTLMINRLILLEKIKKCNEITNKLYLL